ncbi:biotin/lipoyl-containing protein [Paraburkholderia aromaticivorans]|uniref:biotin/lipoyl-containing protein n=1 Tax=Paraburkholderia aromaticivorans TaxID=2026199 RepID=UPI003217F75C
MATIKEIRVPDIGDFNDIPVIEVLIKAGDTVQLEDPLITIESDKATMEVPASEAGIVKEVKIKDLTHAEIPDVVASAYGAQGLRFGPEYLIPKPFDPRLIERIAPAVAKAAMDSGIATQPIADLEAYRLKLRRFIYQSGSSRMEPVFAAAKKTQDEWSTPRARKSGSCARLRSWSTKGLRIRCWLAV